MTDERLIELRAKARGTGQLTWPEQEELIEEIERLRLELRIANDRVEKLAEELRPIRAGQDASYG